MKLTYWLKTVFQKKTSFKIQNYFRLNILILKWKINDINNKKATAKGDIPVKMLQWNSEVIVPVLKEYFRQNIKNSTLPNELKNADISSVHKQKNCYDKSN